MKTCEVCGRRIKTGYKYCWEHRHTSEAGKLHGDRLFKKAEKFYYQWTLMKFMVLGFGLLFLLSFLVFMIGGFGLLMNVVFVFIIITLIIIMYPIVFMNRVIKSEKCEEYITNYLRKPKEEQERRNRIKDEALR